MTITKKQIFIKDYKNIFLTLSNLWITHDQSTSKNQKERATEQIINIFNNLSKVNDKLLIKNNNQEFLILLCNIDYNKELVDNKLYKSKIEKLSEEITVEFIKKHKKIYNFNLFQ